MPTLLAKDIIGVQPMPTNSLYDIFWTKEYNKKYWPHQYTVKRDDVFAAERWCWQRFKGKNWNNKYQKFVFKRSQDAVMFALRWSS